MADAMVVARMPQEKKDSVGRKLAAKGTNASRIINELYDYIEKYDDLPFRNAQTLDQRHEREAQARAWLSGISRLPEGNCFQKLSDDEITQLRLSTRGYDV